MKRLTEKQTAGLSFCGKFFAANDQLPTSQAMADHFGWSSTNAAFEMMEALCRKGYLERNTLGKFRFTAKGKAFITEQQTYARWFPTNGSAEPINGIA